MSESMASVGHAGVEVLVQKLAAFRATLSEPERQVFDAILVAAASSATGDVEGYACIPLTAKHVALAALMALGIGVTTPGPLTGSPVKAAPLDQQSLNTNVGGTLGFALRDTPIQERLHRHGAGAERSLMWSAEFTSRWELNQAQLERWSAQAIGRIADELGGDVRLASYERLDASGVGEQQVAYRYQLASASGQSLGEATIVVFARGDRVGMTATGAIGARSPMDATSLARVLDTSANRG